MKTKKRRTLGFLLALVMIFSQFSSVAVVKAEGKNELEGTLENSDVIQPLAEESDNGPEKGLTENGEVDQSIDVSEDTAEDTGEEVSENVGENAAEDTEEEVSENVGETDRQLDAAASPQEIVQEAGISVQTDDEIVSGTGWEFNKTTQTLTITAYNGAQNYRNDPNNGSAGIGIKTPKVAELKDSVTELEDSAFLNFTSLTEVIVSKSVTKIGAYAFGGCTELKCVIMQRDTPPTLGNGAFTSCNKLEKILVPSGSVEKYKNASKWSDYADKIEADGVASGEGWEIDSNYTLKITSNTGMTNWNAQTQTVKEQIKAAVVDSGVTSIPERAFWNCTGLESIEIPDSVTSIGMLAFYSCSALKTITIPNKVTAIGDSAFEKCAALTKIEIPDSVTSIGSSAFFDCTALTEITISANVTSIEQNTFKQCSALKAITIPDKVTAIKTNAFGFCSELTEITIPAGVTSIGASAFTNCSKLKSVTMQGTKPPTLGNEAFLNCAFIYISGKAIKVPKGSASAYKEAWKDYASKIDGDDESENTDDIRGNGWTLDSTGTLTITSNAGMKDWCNKSSSYTDKVTTVVIQSGVTSINNSAFKGCEALKEITIPAGVTSIGSSAFEGCEALKEITIPDSVTSIGSSAFEGCSALTKIEISSTSKVTTIGGSAFKGCEALKEITIPSKVKTIESNTFEGCSALTEITIPAGVTNIKTGAFSGCEGLESVTMQGTKPPTIGDGVFDGCKFKSDDYEGTEGIKVPDGAEDAYKKKWTDLANDIEDDAGKVDKVDEAVKNVLPDIRISNDTSEDSLEEDINAAVKEALKKAGVNSNNVTVTLDGFDKEEATADAAGSVTVKVTIQIGEESKELTIKKTIKKPATDTEKVEIAKEAVKNALPGIQVSNETDENELTPSIDAAVKKALEEAGIDSSSVTVALDDFDMTDATDETDGNITVNVKITSNGEEITLPITISIKRSGLYVRFMDYVEMGNGSVPCYKYTGTAIKPVVEVYNNGTLLTQGTDYTIVYADNTKVGTALLKVKGKGSFTKTSHQLNFSIINADIDTDTKHPTEMTVVENTKVDPVIMSGARKLTAKDYELAGNGLKNGKYAQATADGKPNTLIVKGVGGYAGSNFTIKVTVVKKSEAKKFAVTVNSKYKPVYDGLPIDLSSLFKKELTDDGVITVTDSNNKQKILEEGTDFTVVCTSGLSDAGTVNFTVTGIGEYTGSVSKNFKIAPLKITDTKKFSVTFHEDKDYEYNASGVTVAGLEVRYIGDPYSDEDDKVLTQGVDYKVTYSNNKKVSGAKSSAGFKITFLGNYNGSTAISKTFKIIPAKLSAKNTTVTVPDKVYAKANSSYKSAPIVSVDGVVINASNYTVSYAWATASNAGDDTQYRSDNNVKITIADGDAYAKVKVTVTPKQTGSYGLAEGAAVTGEYYVRKAAGSTAGSQTEIKDLSKATVTFYDKAGVQLKTLEYNGNTFYTPAGNDRTDADAPSGPNVVYVQVTLKNKEIVDPSLYNVTWTNATTKGKATVIITGKGEAIDIDDGAVMAVGSKNQTININAMELEDLKIYIAEVVDTLKHLFRIR